MLFPIHSSEEVGKYLPVRESLAGQSLPAWARVIAPTLPRTTAALLELEYRQRVLSPIDPGLRARLRWQAARSNGCAYSEAYASVDLHAARNADSHSRHPSPAVAGSSEAEQAALSFADKLSRNGSTITDEEVAHLRELLGDALLVALVQLVAYSSFQDRLVLALGVDLEPDGPLPPLPVHFDRLAPATAPPRISPPSNAIGSRTPSSERWAADYSYLQMQMEKQRQRSARIPVPTWSEVEARWPEWYPRPDAPLRIQWSFACMGYQPELAAAWTSCTSAFHGEAKLDPIFEESLFWVVTQAIDCFY